MAGNPRDHQTLRLQDGRRLGWAEFGDAQGQPVLYCHGWPGSRIEASLLDRAAKRSRVRLIAADRPGMGLSDFLPGRQFTDWPQDASELCDALGLDRFAVMGVSGGTPYALACAARFPERMSCVVVVSGMGPLDRPDGLEGMGWWNRLLIATAQKMPRTVRFLFGPASRLIFGLPGFALFVLRRLLPEPDRTVLGRTEMRIFFGRHVREIFRQGPKGPAHDGEAYLKPWNFRLDDISIPVHLWHGDSDVAVPDSMGRFLALKLSGCQARILPGEGHISLLVDHADEILGALYEEGFHAEPQRRGKRAD